MSDPYDRTKVSDPPPKEPFRWERRHTKRLFDILAISPFVLVTVGEIYGLIMGEVWAYIVSTLYIIGAFVASLVWWIEIRKRYTDD